MDYCQAFKTMQEASEGYPKKGVCDTCPKQGMEDGMLTCLALTDALMNGNNDTKGDD